jgi:hypothetical protein
MLVTLLRQTGWLASFMDGVEDLPPGAKLVVLPAVSGRYQSVVQNHSKARIIGRDEKPKRKVGFLTYNHRWSRTARRQPTRFDLCFERNLE